MAAPTTHTFRYTLAFTLGAALCAPSAWAQDSDADGVSNAGDAFPCDSRYAAQAFAPAEGQHGMLVFEDQWPGWKDWDYNDVVLAYNYAYFLNGSGQVVRVVASFDALALGGDENNGLGLHLPVPRSAVSSITRRVGSGPVEDLVASTADADLVVDVSTNLRELFGDAAGPINARTNVARQVGQPVVVTIDFSTPQAAFQGEAPHDLFIFRSGNRGHEIHRSMFGGTARMDSTLFNSGPQEASSPGRWFIDTQDVPSVLHLPVATRYPAESQDISNLYPGISRWAWTGGAENADFYISPIDATYAYADTNGQVAPTPANPPTATVDVSCIATDVTTPSNATYNASNIADIMGSNWTVPSGVVVTIDYDGPINLYSMNVLGTVRPAGCSVSRCPTLDFRVTTDATIQGSGRINADGLGYLGSYQPGNSRYARTRNYALSGSSYQTGGSHGGYGGRYGSTVTQTYDSARRPTFPGAGGTSYNSTNANYRGGNGGGAIRMVVGGRLTNNGIISANGGRGGRYDTGGAGGSIWIDAAEVSGSAGIRFSANGAYGYYAGGGGGRIAVYGASVNGYAIGTTTSQVNGGAAATGAAYYGGSGTIVGGIDAPSQATLVVANPSSSYNSRYGPTRVGAFGNVTAVSGSVLTSSNQLEPNSLVGLTLRPDAHSAATVTIVSNTLTTITANQSLAGMTAVGRQFFVQDYETDFASALVTGAAQLSTGHLDVAGTTRIDSTASLNIYDLTSDVVDFTGSSRITAYDVRSRQFGMTGSSLLTLMRGHLTDGDLQGSSRITAWTPTVGHFDPIVITAQSLTVGASARIEADGRGYLGSYQPGNSRYARTNNYALSGSSYQTGGSHGGFGGRYGSTVTAQYGSVSQPTTAGAGGTSYNSTNADYRGGNGGGAIRVDVSGTLTLNGRITANGARGGRYDTGGAGGSIWVSAGQLASGGNGLFQANGAYGYYAAGGGGRIAIHHGGLNGWVLSDTVAQVYGGSAATGSAYYGGHGTVLVRGPGEPNGHLWLSAQTNYRSRFGDTVVPDAAFDAITVRGNAHADFTNVAISGALTLRDTASIDMTGFQAGSVAASGSSVLTGTTLTSGATDLSGSARFVLQTLNATGLSAQGSSRIESWLPSVGAFYPLRINADTFDLGASARVEVSGRGYLGSYQPGNSRYARTRSYALSGSSYQTGGSHGGYGGRYGSTVTAVYGDVLQPVSAGAGGTSYNSTNADYRGGNGGGAVRIDVAGRFTLNGRVFADGARGGRYDTGGAGGSVWVNAGELHTTSTGVRVSANGAYGYYAAGGGGRVALYYNALSGMVVNSGTVQALGGSAATGSAYYGGSGTIVYQPGVEAFPSLYMFANANYNSRFGRTPIGAFGVVTAVSGSTLNSNTAFEPGTLAGHTLVANAEDNTRTFTIVSNTANSITVQGTISGAQVGREFYVNDYATQYENVTIEGDVDVNSGYLDVANTMTSAGTSDTYGIDYVVGNYVGQGSAIIRVRSLNFNNLTLNSSNRLSARILTGTNAVLNASSRVLGYPSSVSAVWPLEILVTNLTVGASAQINTAGTGYLGSYQPGNSRYARTNGNALSGSSYQTGGSHGGLGGRYGSTPTAVFGNADQPVTAGAGGTSYNSTNADYRGGNGGGAIRIAASGTFSHFGLVAADGARGGRYDTGGAGGSVWVTSGTLNGAGTFRANGAYGYYAGGGGGRVAVYSSGGTYSGVTQANGGNAATGSRYYGSVGTTRLVTP